MGRVYIRDENGDIETNRGGERQFYSTADGDSDTDQQTTYSESNSLFGGDTANEATYNPSEGRWNDE